MYIQYVDTFPVVHVAIFHLSCKQIFHTWSNVGKWAVKYKSGRVPSKIPSYCLGLRNRLPREALILPSKKTTVYSLHTTVATQKNTPFLRIRSTVTDVTGQCVMSPRSCDPLLVIYTVEKMAIFCDRLFITIRTNQIRTDGFLSYKIFMT